MKIHEDHRLYHDDGTPYPFVPSPNIGGAVEHVFLIMHYTAGSNAEGAIQWLTDPQSGNPDKRVSAHLVIGRDGQITQLVPFDRIAWHAGFSFWEGRRLLNRCSIGIELDNDGALKPGPNGWVAKSGATYQENEVLVEAHWKNFQKNGWQLFPQAQLDAALEVSRLIVEHYQLQEVLGHDDIHVAKVDPGPAFPMEHFREQLFGRKLPFVERFSTRRPSRVYLDEGGLPPHLPPRLAQSPLEPGTQVKVTKAVTSFKVEVIEMPGKKKKKKDVPKKKNKQVVKTSDQWVLVRISGLIGRLFNMQGWMKADLVQNGVVARHAEIYKNIGVVPGPEPPRHPVEYIPEETPVRILSVQGDLAMIGLLQPVPRFKYLQGWVFLNDLAPAEA